MCACAVLSKRLTEASTLTFFERQREALCGLHDLNNALGAEKFTGDDLSTACNLYLQESEGLEEARSEHIRPGGGNLLALQILKTHPGAREQNFFIELLLKSSCPRWTLNVERPVHSLADAEQANGLLQNKEGRHWVACRR